MHVIEKLPPRYPVPARDVITNRTEDPNGFVDCGLTSVPVGGCSQRGCERATEEIFLGVTGLREAAKLAGMVPQEEVQKLREEIDDLAAQLAEESVAAAAWRAYSDAERVAA